MTTIGSSALFTIPQVDFIHEGPYYCQYQTRVSSREFTSPQSATVSFSVIVVLVQPNISLSAPDGGLFWGPQGPEVTRGHSLSLVCSTEPQHQGGSFHLIFDGSNSTRTQLAINHSASFYIPEADYSHQGNYSCVYELTVSSRTFKSTQTAPLTVIIRMVLVQPNISLSAPDGGLFWGPQGPEVTRGHSLSLICSIEPQHQGGSFHLISDGSNSTRTQLAVNHSASFYIPEADYSHQGNYSCVYEVLQTHMDFTMELVGVGHPRK
ncbi:uncharacterized protein LOC134099235 [Sardina pilchardus]|uniref:uncharacterized protein LOC134099235 n=1 Tax=Sardina pilchardus TaxID=27697 RepID=UPI002E0E2BD0